MPYASKNSSRNRAVRKPALSGGSERGYRPNHSVITRYVNPHSGMPFNAIAGKMRSRGKPGTGVRQWREGSSSHASGIHRDSATSSGSSLVASSAAARNRNGATNTMRPKRCPAMAAGKAVSRDSLASAMPHSSASSRSAVSTKSSSVGLRRPPGKDQWPDHGSPSRCVRRMRRIDSPKCASRPCSLGACMIATAASAFAISFHATFLRRRSTCALL